MKLCVVHDEKGFSLIEVLFALLIFAIGVLAIAKMQDNSIKHNTSARAMTEALAAGETRMNQLMALAYTATELTDGSHAPVSVGRYSVKWDVAAVTGVSDVKDILVTVSWTESGGSNHSVCLRTIKAISD